MRALALLEAEAPVIADYPEVIVADEVPMACPVPALLDGTLAPCVDEAQGLRAAYDRALARRGVTSVGRAVNADGVPAALEVLHRWAGGSAWAEDPLPGKNTIAVCHDIRTYYEEAALELVDGPPPGGRQVEAWFYEETEAGRTLMAARGALRDQEAPFPFWFYMAPGHR